jgi:hypothetical protein
MLRKRSCYTISKAVQGQWIDGVCSLLMSDEGHFLISGVPLPVRLLDLTVPDSFLQGYLKECIHRDHSHTIQELKHDIWDETVTINQKMLHQVF